MTLPHLIYFLAGIGTLTILRFLWLWLRVFRHYRKFNAPLFRMFPKRVAMLNIRKFNSKPRNP